MLLWPNWQGECRGNAPNWHKIEKRKYGSVVRRKMDMLLSQPRQRSNSSGKINCKKSNAKVTVGSREVGGYISRFNWGRNVTTV